MKSVLTVLLLATTFAAGGAAMAQDATPPNSYPPCSKSVTDECMTPSRATHGATHAGHAKGHKHSRKLAHASPTKAVKPAHS